MVMFRRYNQSNRDGYSKDQSFDDRNDFGGKFGTFTTSNTTTNHSDAWNNDEDWGNLEVRIFVKMIFCSLSTSCSIELRIIVELIACDFSSAILLYGLFRHLWKTSCLVASALVSENFQQNSSFTWSCVSCLTCSLL